MKLLDTILDIVFPAKCIVCNKAHVELCVQCIVTSPEAERECAEWIYPLYEYRHPPIKKALHFLKYKNKKRLAKILAEVLYIRILEELSELSVMENFREPLLIPIPLSKERHRERGYNQSELICMELQKLDNSRNFLLTKNVLLKTKETIHQARIKNRSERLKNLSGTFDLSENSKKNGIISKRNIILIDDIITTGATLTEAKKTLKKFGAKKIVAFTVAH